MLALLGAILGVPCLAAPRGARAEILKLAQPGDKGLTFFVWPKLQPPNGWKSDIDASMRLGAYALEPSGRSFADAPAVIYGNVVYKPKMPEVTTLDQFIQSDQARFKSEFPNLGIAQEPQVKDGAGRFYRVFAYEPSGKGNWEVTAYGEDRDLDGNDYWLVLVLSARSRQVYQSALPSFREVVRSYR